MWLVSAVGRATVYLDRGPGQLRKQSRQLTLISLPVNIMETEMLFLPMARRAGRVEEVAQLESLLAEARRVEKQLAGRPQPPG